MQNEGSQVSSEDRAFTALRLDARRMSSVSSQDAMPNIVFVQHCASNLGAYPREHYPFKLDARQELRPTAQRPHLNKSPPPHYNVKT